jgi:hypothetical protein
MQTIAPLLSDRTLFRFSIDRTFPEFTLACSLVGIRRIPDN